MEEFRAPLVDRFTLRLFGRRILAANDFSNHSHRGTRLKKASLKVYFEEYQSFLSTPWALGAEQTTFRALFRRQAERLMAAIGEKQPYEAFRWAKNTVWEK